MVDPQPQVSPTQQDYCPVNTYTATAKLTIFSGVHEFENGTFYSATLLVQFPSTVRPGFRLSLEREYKSEWVSEWHNWCDGVSEWVSEWMSTSKLEC